MSAASAPSPAAAEKRRRRKAPSAARDRSIIACRKEGYTLAEIGARHGLTRERIRQILIEHGAETQAERATKLRRKRRLKAAESHLEELLAAFREGQSLPVIAGRLGLSRATVTALIEAKTSPEDHAARRSIAIGRTRREPTSEEVLLGALRLAAERLGQVPTGGQYAEIAQACGLPSISTIKNAFGSWNAGLESAGLTPRARNERPYRRRWTKQSCLAALRALVTELGELPTTTEYVRLAKQRSDLPSLATVRERLGRWSELDQVLGEGARSGPGSGRGG